MQEGIFLVNFQEDRQQEGLLDLLISGIFIKFRSKPDGRTPCPLSEKVQNKLCSLKLGRNFIERSYTFNPLKALATLLAPQTFDTLLALCPLLPCP